VPRNHGQKLSVIGAVGFQGVGAALSVEGAVDTEVFAVFVRRGLVPALRPGDSVLWDNLSVPPASCSAQAVQGAQGQVIFLPPYAPDFSPIAPGGRR
jgi:transposase